MSGRYKIIYADPLWLDKRAFSLENLCAMRVFIDTLAADDCLLAMWWVPPQPAEAMALVEAWGFKFKTMKGFSWRKLTRYGKEHFGMGNLTRANSEDCLFATRGKPQRVFAGVRSVINAQVREHSRKPDEARERLVQLLGDVPRIELFARQRTTGWSAWGDELDGESGL